MTKLSLKVTKNEAHVQKAVAYLREVRQELATAQATLAQLKATPTGAALQPAEDRGLVMELATAVHTLMSRMTMQQGGVDDSTLAATHTPLARAGLNLPPACPVQGGPEVPSSASDASMAIDLPQAASVPEPTALVPIDATVGPGKRQLVARNSNEREPKTGKSQASGGNYK